MLHTFDVLVAVSRDWSLSDGGFGWGWDEVRPPDPNGRHLLLPALSGCWKGLTSLDRLPCKKCRAAAKPGWELLALAGGLIRPFWQNILHVQGFRITQQEPLSQERQ